LKRLRIVLLHATPVAVGPIQAAFAENWPEPETVNLLDDGLTIDRARETDVSEALIERFVDLGRYAHRIGADGILVTCSAFGPAIDRLAATVPVPVVKPNQAMFENALRLGPRIGMLATFKPSIPTMEQEFQDFVRQQGEPASLRTILVDQAMDSLRRGDAATHNRLIAERAPELDGMDAVMLAHFSTSIAAAEVRKKVGLTVLTAPDSAVRQMRQMIEGPATG
jgi:Asp/Glu/hydantoin racemase